MIMTKRFLPLIALVALAFAEWVPVAKASVPQGEWIILVGGVSLNQWEKYKAQPHDHWWANFVHAARIRTEQLREQFGPDLMITWLVYKPAYIERAKQDGVDLIGDINSVRDKFNLHLVYFNKGGDVIDYLNNGQPRTSLKVAAFEYRPAHFCQRRLCEKLGLPYRRRNEQVLARRHRHAHVGRARQDTIHG